MKHVAFLFTFCLVALIGTLAQAQQPQVKILVNSEEQTGSVALTATKRLCFMVSDGMPANAGYAYEFGALQLIPPNGTPVELRASMVENRCLTIYSLRTSWLQTYPQGFKLRCAGITRHNPNNTTTVMPFTQQQLEIDFTPN